jgi:hypothetical protein
MNIRSQVTKTMAMRSVQIGMAAIVVLAIVIFAIARINATKKNQSVVISVAPMQDQKVGEYVYHFDSIDWAFGNEQSYATSQETKVAFQFQNFSRRENKIPAVFSKDFFVGMYEGSCVSAESLPEGTPAPFDTESEECPAGPVVAVALCGADETTQQPIAIHQCGVNLVVSEYVDQDWKEIRTIDMSTLVR